MQGRLLEQSPRGYQAFPQELWWREFPLAKQRGLSHIEWIVDEHAPWSNPLLTNPQTIYELMLKHDLKMPTVCADIFLVHPIRAAYGESWDLMLRILDGSSQLGVSYLVLPCVDAGSLKVDANLNAIKHVLPDLIEAASGFGITVSLETDLDPNSLRGLIAEDFDSHVKVTYDIGNSASLGYDWSEEIGVLASDISCVHVKDRTLGGGSVPLGTGDADVLGALNALVARGFDGPVTMQAYRDREGLTVFDEQLAWLRAGLAQ